MKYIKITLDEAKRLVKGDKSVIDDIRQKIYGCCIYCGNEFLKHRADAKYCSPGCVQRKWAEEHPDKIKEHKKRYSDKQVNNGRAMENDIR